MGIQIGVPMIACSNPGKLSVLMEKTSVTKEKSSVAIEKLSIAIKENPW